MFLWLSGLFYTGRIIVNSSKRYLRYPAQIYEREGDAGLYTVIIIVNIKYQSSHHIPKNIGLFKLHALALQTGGVLLAVKCDDD